MKIRPVRAEILHADRRTDMTKLIVAFRNFATLLKIPHNTFLVSLHMPGVIRNYMLNKLHCFPHPGNSLQNNAIL
jgi:hypothetical protein